MNDQALQAHIDRCRGVVWGSIYRPIWEICPPVPKAYNNRGYAVPSGLCAIDPIMFEVEATETAKRVDDIRVFRNKRVADSLSWEAYLNTQRVAAIRKWVGIISTSPGCFDLGRRWNRLEPLGQSLAEGLKDVFSGKATGTLHARSGPLLRFVSWCHESGEIPFPIFERTVYRFMQETTHAAPTFLRSFLVSLRFSHHLLGLSGAVECIDSQRVVGRARAAYLEKRRLLQKAPFTTAVVIAMEVFVCNSIQPCRERFVIGCFLLCIYLRARFSDLQNIETLTADTITHNGLPGGYVEATITRSKTAFTTERKTMYLPMACPRCGLTGKDWFDAWRRAQLEAEVPRGEGVPTFPALTNVGWSRVPITAGAAADWMRKILVHLGFNSEQVSSYGTHSAKTTTLSWLSKFGSPLELRQLLGYHSTGGSALVYSRDAMAEPLRELIRVIGAIRVQQFWPDHTRSGYFSSNAGGEDNIQQDVLHIPAVDEISDSEDSADEEDLSKDMPLIEEATDSVVGAWSEHATVVSLGLDEEPTLFRNNITRYLHVCADESGARFRCGRDITTSYSRLEEKPRFCSPQCRQCFRTD